MKLLPIWKFTHTLPAYKDSESATAIEQTYKLYQAMNELIEECNVFTQSINEKILEFINKYEEDIDTFTTSIRQEFQDFIDVVELKIAGQDQAIQDEFNELTKLMNDEITRVVNEVITALETRVNNLELEKASLEDLVILEEDVETLKTDVETLKNSGGGGTKIYKHNLTITFTDMVDDTFNMTIYSPNNTPIDLDYLDGSCSLEDGFTLSNVGCFRVSESNGGGLFLPFGLDGRNILAYNTYESVYTIFYITNIVDVVEEI